MTMYRGEAANHGILDAYHLVQSLEMVHDGRKPQKQALEEYESELRQRTNPAVLLSRQACLDAHDFNGLNQDSAVLQRRAIDTKGL
jgi:2-polyprenyl-6-methoxyphenol hydroxylase-like FAD-dependent oxidoreductase